MVENQPNEREREETDSKISLGPRQNVCHSKPNPDTMYIGGKKLIFINSRYQNQPEVAQGIKKALEDIPGLKRADIFIVRSSTNCHILGRNIVC